MGIQDSKGLAFVASFISRSARASLSEVVKVDASSGDTGDFCASCKRLVNAAGPEAINLLYSEEICSQVDEWLANASSFQGDRERDSSNARLRTYDSYLLKRTVFVGSGTTVGLADIAVFVVIHDSLAALPTEEQKQYPNLLRWVDYVQHKDDASHAYEWIPVQKAKFDPPASSAEPDSKKPVAAALDSSVKDKETKTSSQQKPRPTDTKDKEPVQEAVATGKVIAQDDTKKAQQKEKKEPAPVQKDLFGPDILDVRVGVIKTVKKHPTAETLYVEEIDVGEGSLRQIVSGLAKYLTEDQMLNRRVLVLANVKPSKLRDVMSSGLVLCASNKDHSQCEPIIPPEKATIGERITIEGYDGKPEPVLNPKKKQWEKLYPDLLTDENGVACYKGTPLSTSAGPCISLITKGTIK